MSEQSVDFVLVATDQAEAGKLGELVDSEGAGQAQIVSRSNLDGAAASWLVLAAVLIRQLPAILTFVKEMVELNRVISIKIGDVEIDHPTADHVERLLRDYPPVE